MPGWGRPAYEAYLESCGGESIRGEKLPSWEAQQPGIRKHWEHAADAVIAAYIGADPAEAGHEHPG